MTVLKMQFPVFLDNNSTTKPDPRVLEEFVNSESKYFGNASSNHVHGWQANESVKIAAEKIALTLGANPECIIFTSGASEANNLAIHGYFSKNSLRKIKSYTSKLEHSSVIDNFDILKNRLSEITLFENDNNGVILLKDTTESGCDFVSLHLANNEIGTIQPVQKLRDFFPDAFIHSDCSQALGKIKVNLDSLKTDCITISSHKIHGPKGIGALVFNSKNSMSQINSQILGGDHQFGLRSGTLPVGLISAFGEAVKICNDELDTTTLNLRNLTTIFLNNLRETSAKFSLIGPESVEDRLPGNLSINFLGVDSGILLTKLTTKISFSTGSACQQNTSKKSHVLESLNLSEEDQRNVVRIGIGKFNSEEEIVFASKLIGNTASTLQK